MPSGPGSVETALLGVKGNLPRLWVWQNSLFWCIGALGSLTSICNLGFVSLKTSLSLGLQIQTSPAFSPTFLCVHYGFTFSFHTGSVFGLLSCSSRTSPRELIQPLSLQTTSRLRIDQAWALHSSPQLAIYVVSPNGIPNL